MGRIKLYTRRENPRILFLHSERQGQEDRCLRAGEGSRGRASGGRRFLWGRVLDGTTAASGNSLRTVTECVIVRITKADITRVIHEEPAFTELFIAHLLARNSRVEEDLVDQLFNSSEKRLARTLLLLAHFFWQGRSAGANRSENQPRDTGRDDRHDAISRELFHEQISEIGSY
jgi:hypothetical protein